jgi:hypothetical protein
MNTIVISQYKEGRVVFHVYGTSEAQGRFFVLSLEVQ